MFMLSFLLSRTNYLIRAIDVVGLSLSSFAAPVPVLRTPLAHRSMSAAAVAEGEHLGRGADDQVIDPTFYVGIPKVMMVILMRALLCRLVLSAASSSAFIFARCSATCLLCFGLLPLFLVGGAW